MTDTMSKTEAVSFFADFYGGEHHFPNDVKEFGPDSWSMNHFGNLATFDSDALTRLVFLAHDRCVRVGIQQSGPRHVKIVIWKRTGRTGSIMERHPTLEQALEAWRKRHPAEGKEAPNA